MRKRLTLSVQVVGDGNRVVTGWSHTGFVVAEGVLSSRVLLLQVLDLILQWERFLYHTLSDSVEAGGRV